MSKSEKEKMLSGEEYVFSEELMRDTVRAKLLCQKYNKTSLRNAKKRARILDKLLGGHGKKCEILPSVWFDYGYNVFVGENFFANHGCVFLDGNKITFGDNVLIAPNCSFFTAEHPTDAEKRRAGVEFAKPITVGNNVWFGGGVTVLAGVTIGDNVTVGAGSVVKYDLPSGCIAAGIPARVVKKL